jgi:hypothetical protein
LLAPDINSSPVRQTDSALAATINDAINALHEAVEKQAESIDLVYERKKTVGLLLLEARRRHSGRTAFTDFLKAVNGVSFSYAMKLIKGAANPAEFEKLRAANTAYQQRSRDKKKAKAQMEPEKPAKPEPVSYVRDVETSVAKNTDLDLTVEEMIAARHSDLSDEFAIAAGMLMKLVTKPSDKFVGVISAANLKVIADFLMQIAATDLTIPADLTIPSCLDRRITLGGRK